MAKVTKKQKQLRTLKAEQLLNDFAGILRKLRLGYNLHHNLETGVVQLTIHGEPTVDLDVYGKGWPAVLNAARAIKVPR
jgi:hypothetical protein